ncbi:MAG: hypothetical protein R2770_00925 [Acidimicrobiales bacterium]|nr:hypothetical protein [Acidimicrobiales bacterium]
MIAYEVPLVDRLMVGDPITQEVKSLNPVVDIGAHNPRIAGIRMVRKGSRQRRNPQRRQVVRGAQEPPEPETQLRYHLTVRLRPTATSGPTTGRINIVPGAPSRPPREQRPLPIPDLGPSPRLAVCDQGDIDRIAEDHLETTEILVQSSANLGVPVVQLDSRANIASRHGQIRREPVRGETINDRLMIER